MNTGAWVLLVTLALSAAFGLYRALTDGRFRGTHQVRGAEAATTEAAPTAPAEVTAPPEESRSLLAGTPWEDQLGGSYTLLQFSSAFCAPCRATRRILEDVAVAAPGVVHVEVDAEHHLDLVRRLGVLRTPTTLILDARGAEITRATGAPTKQQVLGALGAV